jgi:hypothetical protein
MEHVLGPPMGLTVLSLLNRADSQEANSCFILCGVWTHVFCTAELDSPTVRTIKNTVPPFLELNPGRIFVSTPTRSSLTLIYKEI